ncbi:MAG: metal ABC transporter permease [Lachnospiraceae bacterium]|nr:metal ABC transporter permease [Lachnospiraceae bacterium]
MNFVYEVFERLLPFSFMQYDFMKNALIAVLIITPLFGMLGTMIVNNKMAFFSDALGHSAFTGIAIGVIFGFADLNVTMVLFAIVFALLLNRIKRRNAVSTDTIISVFSSLGSAIGLVVLSQNGNFSKYSSILVGDILSITPAEIGWLLLIFVVAMIFFGTCFNQLHSMSINVSLANSKGIRIKLLDDIFAVMIAMIIMLSIRWVGILMINALLILPAAAARNLAENVREYHGFSVVISMFSGILGLLVSYFVNTATGPTIIIIASAVFFLTLLTKPLVK